MSWMAAAFVFLSLFLELNHGGGTGLANEQPPIQASSPPVSPSGFFTSNPLDSLVMSVPNEVNMIFGMEFIDNVRMIKNDCEWKEYMAEMDLQQERKELMNFVENIDELKDEKFFKDLPPDEQNRVQISAQVAVDDLVKKQSDREDTLAKQCNSALMKLEDERMRDALNFAKTKLRKGTGAFVTYVNQVADYGQLVENALAECLNTYANELLSRYYRVRLSPSEICMQVEVEILVRFINEFVVRASQLVITYADDEDLDSLTSGSGSIERVPPRIPESFPRPYAQFNQLPKEPDTTEEAETAKPDTDDDVDGQHNGQSDSDFGSADENHEPMPSPVSHEYTEQIGEELLSAIASNQAKDKTRPTNLSSCKSSTLTPHSSPVVGIGTDRSGSKGTGSGDSQQGNEFTRPFRPTRPDAGKGGRPGAVASLGAVANPGAVASPDAMARPGAVARPAASAKPKRPIPYQRPARPEGDNNQRPIRPLSRPPHSDERIMPVSRPSSSVVPAELNTLTAIPSIEPSPSAETIASSEEQGHSTLVVMIVFGTTAVILVLAIIVLAVFIGITKYRTAKKGWTKLTEHEKVDLMKRSGYVNPTYQFFDRVTQ